jgi:hypothetical protein
VVRLLPYGAVLGRIKHINFIIQAGFTLTTEMTRGRRRGWFLSSLSCVGYLGECVWVLGSQEERLGPAHLLSQQEPARVVLHNNILILVLLKVIPNTLVLLDMSGNWLFN